MVTMGKCKHFRVCEVDDPNLTEGDLCILHSTDPYKSRMSFTKALDAHRQREHGASNFGRMVFPDLMDFTQNTFNERADFSWTEFMNGSNFDGATFAKGANFARSKFTEDVNFQRTTFAETAWFNRAVFTGNATFWDSTFSRVHFTGTKFEGSAEFCAVQFLGVARFGETEFRGEANFSDSHFADVAFFPHLIFSAPVLFSSVRFGNGVIFNSVIFMKNAEFSNTVFHNECEFAAVDFAEEAVFTGASFLERTIFSGGNGNSVFLGETNFEKVISTDEALRFVQVDLSRCRFLGADVRKIQFIGVKWSIIGDRDGICDELACEPNQWAYVEDIYRQLKQNYENRRDFERAGHFHVGEKEMRLRNTETRVDLRVLLSLYKLLAMYGESYRQPLLWFLGLWLYTSLLVLVGGLVVKDGTNVVPLSTTSLSDFGWAFLYGLQTIFHLNGKEFTPQGFGWVVHMLASILGPVLVALAGFALRQRLKR